MNYFSCVRLLAFHLLLAYLGGSYSIHAAFLISSMFRSYSWSATCAWWWICDSRWWRRGDATDLSGLFSYAFFFEGFTGLSGDD